MQSEPRKRPRTELTDNIQANLSEEERLQIKMIEELLLNQGFSDYDDEFEDLNSEEMIRVEQEATQKYFDETELAQKLDVVGNVQNDDSTEMAVDQGSDPGDSTEFVSARLDLIPSPQTQAHTQAHTESLFSLKQKLALSAQKEADLEKSLFDKVGECEFARSKINQLQVDNDRLKRTLQTIERESSKEFLEGKKKLEDSVSDLKTQISFKVFGLIYCRITKSRLYKTLLIAILVLSRKFIQHHQGQFIDQG
jgi:predicted Zn-dependent protease with MMP-like domain